MFSRSKLHNYQEEDAAKIANKVALALWLPMGLGKTITTLTAIADLIELGEIKRVLIIAPLRVCNTVWEQEAAQWEHTKHLEFTNIAGLPERKRRAALMNAKQIVIVNRENVETLSDWYGKKWPFDMVVIDEASSFKSVSAKRWKGLMRVRKYISRIVELTGTPTSNSLIDLFAQISLLDMGYTLGKSAKNFKNTWFECQYGTDKWTPREGAFFQIMKRVAPLVSSRNINDHIDMPEKQNVTVTVPLMEFESQYKKLEKDFIIELQSGDVTAINAAALTGKLLQFCQGAVYDENKQVHHIHDLKIEALQELVEENPGEPLLVAYQFRHDLERLQRAFPQSVSLDKNPETVDRWNRGEIPILLAHPASAGHGLNLQHGGSIAVWFGLTWSLELYLQFNARLHRQGQRNTVRIVHIVTDSGIERVISRALINNENVLRQVLEFANN